VGAAEKEAHKNGGAQVNRGGRPRADLSLLLDALFYRLRNAGPWRDLPERFGPWSTVRSWHARRAKGRRMLQNCLAEDSLVWTLKGQEITWHGKPDS
jgi:transposase